jgi:transposase
LKQMILGLVIDGDGWPICTEMWPGNTADVATLLNVIDRLRQRFAIRRVCVVADRGMISAATIAGLEERGLEYILGARERSDAVAKSVVLKNKDPFVPLLIERERFRSSLQRRPRSLGRPGHVATQLDSPRCILHVQVA